MITQFRVFGSKVSVPQYKQQKGKLVQIQLVPKIYLGPHAGGHFKAIDTLTGEIKHHVLRDSYFDEDTFPSLQRSGKGEYFFNDDKRTELPDDVAQDFAVEHSPTAIDFDAPLQRAIDRNNRMELDPTAHVRAVVTPSTHPGMSVVSDHL